MHRFPRLLPWLGILLLAAAGCRKEDAGLAPGPPPPNGDVIETIVRVVTPDHPFYTIPFPADPDADPGETGVWKEDTGGDDYRDDARFALTGEAFFVSPGTSAQVPFLVQIGTTGAGASVRVVVDQVRGTLGIFGLKDHQVQLTLTVYRLR